MMTKLRQAIKKKMAEIDKERKERKRLEAEEKKIYHEEYSKSKIVGLKKRAKKEGLKAGLKTEKPETWTDKLRRVDKALSETVATKPRKSSPGLHEHPFRSTLLDGYPFYEDTKKKRRVKT